MNKIKSIFKKYEQGLQEKISLNTIPDINSVIHLQDIQQKILIWKYVFIGQVHD